MSQPRAASARDLRRAPGWLVRQAIGELPTHAIDFHLIAAYLACCDRSDSEQDGRAIEAAIPGGAREVQVVLT